MSTSPATGGSVSAREVLLAGDVHDAARAEVVLGEYRWLRGDQAGSSEHFIAAEGLAERMTDESAKLRVLANLGRFAMLGDENERAVALGRPALALAEKLGDDEMRAHVLNNIGVARFALGEREGLDDLEASLEIARRVGGPEYVRACGNLASVLACEGQLPRSAELHREGLQISQELGYEEPTRWLSTEIASDHMLAGNWEEARRIVDALMPGYEESPFWIEPQTRVCRARMLIAEGAVEDAVVDADRAVAVVQSENRRSRVSATRSPSAHDSMPSSGRRKRQRESRPSSWTSGRRRGRRISTVGCSMSGSRPGRPGRRRA